MSMTDKLSQKSYANYFGKAMLAEVLDLMPELNEAKKMTDDMHPIEREHPVLWNFLHHLTSPTSHHHKTTDFSINEDFDILDVFLQLDEDVNHPTQIKAAGVKGLEDSMTKSGHTNPHAHMKAGFHAAFPDDEDAKTTNKKAAESQKHFRNFMHERGGHSKNNTLSMYGQNGKTRSSSGADYKVAGLSLSPSHEAGYKHDMCPNATKECRKNCLGLTAGGNRIFPVPAARAKLLRTQYIHEHPEHAARLMSHELTAHEKKAKAINHTSGVRNNVTSDIQWEHQMPKKFFDKHKDSTFYDYTKMHGRLKDGKKLPPNYHLALSHTGANHPESNDKETAEHLKKGGVSAMVYQRTPKPKNGVAPVATHVHDVSSGKHYPIVNGDKDDNVFDRHNAAGVDKTHGVVSGLKLKGVTNAKAGKFANKVDHKPYKGKPHGAAGVIHINHPKDHPDHWSHHPEEHEGDYQEHPEHFSRKHKDDKNPFTVLNNK